MVYRKIFFGVRSSVIWILQAEKRNICTQDKAGKLRRRFIKDNIKSREIKMRRHWEMIIYLALF